MPGPGTISSKEMRTVQPDPVDQWFPKRGQCQLCGVPGVDQRHRVIEAIADMVNAGDSEESVAADYGVPVEAVAACLEWVRAHPDGLETS